MKITFPLLFFLFLFGAASAQTYKYDSNHQLTEIKHDNGSLITFQYDANGNRVQSSFFSSIVCPGSTASFYTNINGTAYQWQVDTGTGFLNIVNGSIYSGATTNNLLLTNAPTSWYGYKYRCVIDGSIFSNDEVLKFVSTWIGGKDTAWENPANWGCNKLPDQNTDVIINGNALFFPVVNSNVSVRTLAANPSSKVQVSSGFQLTVLH